MGHALHRSIDVFKSMENISMKLLGKRETYLKRQSRRAQCKCFSLTADNEKRQWQIAMVGMYETPRYRWQCSKEAGAMVHFRVRVTRVPSNKLCSRIQPLAVFNSWRVTMAPAVHKLRGVSQRMKVACRTAAYHPTKTCTSSSLSLLFSTADHMASEVPFD